METEQQVSKAKDVVRDLLARLSKPHHRIHGETAEDNVQRLRALEGLCGGCANLNLRFGRKDGKNIATLGCEKGFSPVALYGGTPLGEKAVCKEYNKAERNR